MHIPSWQTPLPQGKPSLAGNSMQMPSGEHPGAVHSDTAPAQSASDAHSALLPLLEELEDPEELLAPPKLRSVGVQPSPSTISAAAN